MIPLFMCLPTVIHNDSLWPWRPRRGGVSGIFGNSGLLRAESGRNFVFPAIFFEGAIKGTEGR
jgi:hypothetical protein